jgi:hypothetical protein
MISTGNTHMDAQRAYDRLARARKRDALMRRLRRRCVECARLAVFEPHGVRRSAGARGVREIPLDAITATVEPARARHFDYLFRPAGGRTRGRWERLWIAEQRGETLPPISVVQVGSGFAVLDGHHRVSVARARGAATIDAVVEAA